MALLFFLFSSIMGSGFFKHVADRVKTAVRSGEGPKCPRVNLSGKNHRLATVFLVVMVLLLSLTVSSCAALIYDLIEGGDRSPQKHSLTVVYDYTGYYSGYSLYIAAFGFEFSGNEPDLVYMSGPLSAYSGSHIFYDLEEMSYGVLAFIDLDADGEPSSGDRYEFYKDVPDNPSEIDLKSNMSVNVSFNDSYSWTDGFYENFDDGIADNWIDDGSGMWAVSGYKYVMLGKRTDSYACSYYNDEFYDFTYEVSVEQNDGDTTSARGIFFRAQNPTGFKYGNLDGYLFRIDSSGYWSLEKNTGASFLTIDSGTSYSLYPGIGVSNTIRVECYGTRINIYVNGTTSPLCSTDDNQFLSGKVGIFGFDSNGPYNPDEFWFDDAMLY